jgi:isopenicillin N synthase-like dioxygenase
MCEFLIDFKNIFVYSETMKKMGTKMVELHSLILKMILDGYGLPKQYTSTIEELKYHSSFRFMKYKVPEINKDCEIALVPHTDKNTLTILCQNEVQGLEFLTKDNKWIQLDIPQEGCIVIVGDTLKVLLPCMYCTSS